MGRALLDLIGLRFERLLVIERVGTYKAPNGTTQPWWLCRCLCGREKTVLGPHLKAGLTRSCGCLRKETMAATACKNAGNKYNLKHGHSNSRPAGNPSPTYSSWQAMKQRCLDQNAEGYPKYGALGVTICDRWLESFENFLQDMGPRPTGTSLSRFSDVGNYEPGKCAWHTRKEQAAEQRKKRLLRAAAEKTIPEQIVIILPTISPAQQVSV